MKVKILSSYPKQTFEVGNVYFSSDLHLNHESVIKFGRKFDNVGEMNTYIQCQINSKVGKDDLLVLLGDTVMGEKNYVDFLSSLLCENVILLVGNHCNRGKLLTTLHESDKLVFLGDCIELVINKQIICCSHYPMFNWNYQDDGSFMLHGHTHGDESDVLKQIHEYKCMDVGIDSYYNMFGEYSLFNFEQICSLLKDKKVIGRHE